MSQVESRAALSPFALFVLALFAAARCEADVRSIGSASTHSKAVLTQGFDAVGAAVSPGPTYNCELLAGWTCRNNSAQAAASNMRGGWGQGWSTVFGAQAGAAASWAMTGFDSAVGSDDASAWLISPVVQFGSGAQLEFYARKFDSNYQDVLEVRASTAGTGTDVGTTPTSVGDFTTLVFTATPGLSPTGVPAPAPFTCPSGGVVDAVSISALPRAGWCRFAFTGARLPASGSGRIAFRLATPSSGPNGANSHYVGIDSFTFTGPTAPPAPAPASLPNLTLFGTGTVYAVTALADGSVVVGGSFTSVYDPITQLSFARRNLAKFLPSGGLDFAWDPSPNGTVSALASDGAGAVYVGGTFTSIGGLARSNLAKIPGSGPGAADAAWNPSPNIDVLALALGPSSLLYVGGDFSAIGGQNLSRLARISTAGAGAADAAWAPQPDNNIEAIAVDPNGDVYVGGFFSTIGGQSRSRIAKVSGSGAGLADASWNPGPVVRVYALAANATSVYVGGDFGSIGGQTRLRLAKLSTGGTGAADPAWDPGANQRIRAIVIDPGGWLYVGGDFTILGGQPTNYLAKLTSSGIATVDTTWNPSPNNVVLSLALDPAGRLCAGGVFGVVGGQLAMGIARVTSTGSVVSAPFAQVQGQVNAIARGPDGSHYVGGAFGRADLYVRRNILKLRNDGTIDPNWSPAVSGGAVKSITVAPDGSVFAAGGFQSAGGQSRYLVAKMSDSGAGTVDPTWNPNLGGGFTPVVNALALDSLGALYLGGDFSTVGGVTMRNVAKVSSAGSGLLDPSWNAATDNTVTAVGVDAAGDVYLGGFFATVKGVPRSGLAKVGGSGSGTVDASWDPAPNSIVSAFAFDAGNVYVGGGFGLIGGLTRTRLAKVSVANGAVDPVWDAAAASGNWSIEALALDSPSGSLFASGGFATIAGSPRSGIAKLATQGTGQLDEAWNPSPNGPVLALNREPGGTIYVGGSFSTIGGNPRSGIAALPAIVDPIFSSGFEGP